MNDQLPYKPMTQNSSDTFVEKMAEFLRGDRKYPPHTPFWCDQKTFDSLMEKAKEKARLAPGFF